MKAMSYSDVRSRFAAELDRVCEDHVPLIITRQGKPSAVLLSLEDYESLDETSYLLRSPANAERLLKSIRELETGKVVTMNVKDLVP
jgi:antitoxin YefM